MAFEKALIGFGFSDIKILEIPGYKFPYWTHALGQTMTASIFGGIFFWALYLVIDYYLNEKVSYVHSVRACCPVLDAKDRFPVSL